MIILVDYDNILIKHREKGLNELIDMILELIDFSIIKTTKRINIRLYSGWYQGNKLTRVAQNLTSMILSDYPRLFIRFNNKEKKILTINAELAYSLAINPTKHFWHTYRLRSFSNKIICEHPSKIGCNNNDCPLNIFYNFINNEECPVKGCNIKPNDILYKAEQKLVDTMITTDLIYYSSKNNNNLGIVTSDDDLWPGIMSAVLNGATITHIHTKRNRNIPIFYSKGIGEKYIEKNM